MLDRNECAGSFVPIHSNPSAGGEYSAGDPSHPSIRRVCLLDPLPAGIVSTLLYSLIKSLPPSSFPLQLFGIQSNTLEYIDILLY